ncbi:MAG: zinc ABC transporter substrate-binding protein [Saprospiraceae bacterium]
MKTLRYIFLIIPFFSFAQEKPLVVATASIFADMAEVIAGGLVDVESIVPIGGDPHIYEPTPANAQLVHRADLVLKNGLTFEGWLNELIENSGTKAAVATITEGITPISSEKYQNSSDPHAWMAAKNGLVYIENIKNALISLDPIHKEEFTFNYEIYKQQLEDLDQEIMDQIATIPAPQRILITSHDAFRYYGQHYGVRVEAVLGTSTDAEVQTSDMVRLNKVIKSSGVPALFIETTVNPKLLKQLASDNHIQIGGQLYSDSIGDKDSPAPTYIEMLRYNTNTIVEALSRETMKADKSTKKSNTSNYALIGILIVLLAGGFMLVFRRLNQA